MSAGQRSVCGEQLGLRIRDDFGRAAAVDLPHDRIGGQLVGAVTADVTVAAGAVGDAVGSGRRDCGQASVRILALCAPDLVVGEGECAAGQLDVAGWRRR